MTLTVYLASRLGRHNLQSLISVFDYWRGYSTHMFAILSHRLWSFNSLSQFTQHNPVVGRGTAACARLCCKREMLVKLCETRAFCFALLVHIEQFLTTFALGYKTLETMVPPRARGSPNSLLNTKSSANRSINMTRSCCCLSCAQKILEILDTRMNDVTIGSSP